MESPPIPSPILPRAHVLSYLASANSPTRVRQIAARALIIIAILLLLLAALAATAVSFHIFRYLYLFHTMLFFGPMGVTLTSYLMHSLLRHDFGWIALFLYSINASVALIACAAPVRRGKKVACRMAFILLLPTIVIMLLLAAGLIGGGLFAGTSLGGRDTNPFLLLLLIPGILAVLATLLFWDLGAYLRWIAKNPITEIPPIPFLPRQRLPLTPPRKNGVKHR